MRALLAAAVLLGTFGLGAAEAQTYPAKPIRLVVPYGPGGASDQLARAIGEQLSAKFGQPVVIENKGGGGTIIGTDFVAKAAPDGYTIGLATFANLVSSPLLSPNVPYNVDRDFEGVGLLATSPMVMVVDPALPAKNVREFVDYAKANPNRINYGSSGSGSTVHLAAELFKSIAKVELVHVPYKTSPEVINAIVGGFIQVAFDIVITAKPHIDAGKVRALATTGATRTALMPDVPTVAESGYPDYEASTWYGLIVPRGTPKTVIQSLNSELSRILADPAMRNTFANVGMELKASGPADFMEFARAERDKWGKIIAAQNLRAP